MIRYDLPAAEYHAHPARSKSYLWRLYSRTPAHAEYGERETTPAMDVGTAVHTAVLEPHLFEAGVIRGPDDRRGNKWKDAQDEAAAYSKLLLTSGDYDRVRRMADAARRLPIVRQLAEGAIREASAFWADPETGVECRARPDIYHPGLQLLADLKTTADAGAEAWKRTAANFGYHAQEAWYTDGWQQAGGGDVDGFVFVVIENEYPHLAAAYELSPADVAEGRAAMHRALDTYKACTASGVYPGYPAEVQELSLPGWAFRETSRQLAA